jgi:hypothetical protein
MSGKNAAGTEIRVPSVNGTSDNPSAVHEQVMQMRQTMHKTHRICFKHIEIIIFILSKSRRFEKEIEI